MNTFSKWVIKKEAGINRELFKNYFHSQMLSALLNNLYKTNDPEKHNVIVALIKSESKDLQEETKKMSENEKKIKNKKNKK